MEFLKDFSKKQNKNGIISSVRVVKPKNNAHFPFDLELFEF